MIPAIGAATARAATAVTAALIVVSVLLLSILGLVCDAKRREYVTHLNDRAWDAVRGFFGT